MRPKLGARLQSLSGRPLAPFTALPLPSRIAVLFLVLLTLLAVFAPLIAPHGPLATGTPVQPPSADHWMGTDSIGRDIFSRVAHGARSSLLIGLAATAAALAAAAVLGSFAATAAKLPSEILMRALDVVMSFPGIALAAVFVAVFGTSLPVLIFAIGFLYVPQLARVVRANVLSQFGEDYVAASQVMGASTPWILVKHVARNCIAPIMVFATVLVADAIVLEASLSFINAGVQPPAPSWGNILSQGKQLLLAGYWWPTFFPGLAILLTVLSLNILSEGLTDAMASPRIRTKVDVGAEEAAQAGRATPAAATPALASDDADDAVDADGNGSSESPEPGPTSVPQRSVRPIARPRRVCCTTPSPRSAPPSSPARSARWSMPPRRPCWMSRTCTSPSRRPTARPTSSTASPSRCVPARPWAWWASPVRASPSRASQSWDCCPAPPGSAGRSCWATSTCSRCPPRR